MTLRRRVKRVGGSLGVLSNQVVVEPVEGSLDAGAFGRAFAAVLRRHRRGFEQLAAYDRGDWQPPPR